IRKDPGIPNLWPWKDKLLQKLEASKLALSLSKKTKTKPQSIPPPIALDTSPLHLPDQKAHVREVNQVLSIAQVVLQVLDARDPLGTRCRKLESQIIAQGQIRLVLVLNKIDLIPRSNLLKWLKYLRNDFPTVAFKSNTQHHLKRLGQLKGNPEDIENEKVLKSGECLGAETLVSLIKSIAKDPAMPSHLTVGVVGFPNVGKSSLINSLKRTSVCSVAPVPGHTTYMSSVELDSHITMIDSPGIVQFKVQSTDSWEVKAQCLLRNAVKVEQMQDPLLPIQYILKQVDPEVFKSMYQLHPQATWDTVDTFVALVAKKKGKLLSQGRPDVFNTARLILNDWFQGRLPYYSEPPECHPSLLSTTVSFNTTQGDTFTSTSLHPTSLSSSTSSSAYVVAPESTTNMSIDTPSIDMDSSTQPLPTESSTKKQVFWTPEEMKVNPRTNLERKKKFQQLQKLKRKLNVSKQMKDVVEAVVPMEVE
ncbi:Guanine nucleotide-binding protein-like 3, partial [Coelomomyces lativittatus]